MLTRCSFATWAPRVLPALMVALAYYLVSGYLIRNNLKQTKTQWTERQHAHQTLERKKTELDADLQRIHENNAELEKSKSITSRTSLVAIESVNSSQTFASLLEIFELHRLSCEKTENKDQASAGKSTYVNYSFELVGSFLDVKTALQDIVDKLPHVAPSSLTLRRESNGLCRWEIIFQMEKELL